MQDYVQGAGSTKEATDGFFHKAFYKNCYFLLWSFLKKSHGNIKSIIFQSHVSKYDLKKVLFTFFLPELPTCRKKQLIAPYIEHLKKIIKIKYMSLSSFIILI